MTSKIKVNILADGGDNSIITSDGAGSFTASSGLASSVQSVGGLQNTPIWKAGITSQSLDYNTATKINFDNEITDTDNAYDTTNKRFTVPSGKGGTYIVHTWYRVGTGTDSPSFDIFVYKNGSNLNNTEDMASFTVNQSYNTVQCTGMLELSAGDYLEIYARQAEVAGTYTIGYSNEGRFWGYKLIGA